MSKRTERINANKAWRKYQEAKAYIKAFEYNQKQKQDARRHNRNYSNFGSPEELRKCRQMRLLCDSKEYAELKFLVDHHDKQKLDEATIAFYKRHLATLLESINNYREVLRKTNLHE
ncbi:hypothetical protein MA9V1_251 [Chryseobacterium phage MA9V-1]|nr:hypothetical protein MA9V1_251 [Chryseobacterium phage MA9V-1]